MVQHELDPSLEWTLFDDDQIVTKGAWTDMIQQFVELREYPTVLFYEKLTSTGEVRDVVLDHQQFKNLLEISQHMNNEWGDFGGGFSQEEMLQQFALLKQLISGADESSHNNALQ